MIRENDRKSLPAKEQTLSGEENIPELIPAGLHSTSGKQLANQFKGTAAKDDSRYWLSRIFKPVNDRRETSPHYSMRISYLGTRMAFGLGTGNKEAGAKKAAGIYKDLLILGVEATLAKHRPQTKQPTISTEVATVGKWIEAARGVSAANSATFSCYTASLRLIVSQILKVRKTKKRFGPKKGGASEYRAGIDSASLDILSPQAVQRWRLAYVGRHKNPAHERSRMTSANSTIRQARSLFADKIVRFLPEMKLPDPLPFADVEFFPKQNARYFSRIDPKALLRLAKEELAEADPPAFLAMLLALAGGLRRGEIDALAWHQVDCKKAVIRVETTEAGSVKTTDSRGEVPLDPWVATILQGYKAKATGTFVIDGEDVQSGPRKWGRHYRADATFTRLNDWLRRHGVTARKPLHELRKELGSLVTAEHGIYAASRVLRHSTVATTAAHYTDLKSRPTIDVGSWLEPENVVAMVPVVKGKKVKEKKKVA